MGYSDSTRLMRRAAKGDSEAFVCLYDRFAPTMMHFFAMRYADPTMAEDLTQKVFICLWERRKSFRAESSFETYLYSIAKHCLSKEIRESCKAAKTGLKRHPELNKSSHSGLSEPEEKLYIRELAAAIRQAKATMTFEERQALKIAQDGHIPLRIASRKLGCSYKAYKGRLQRARKRLKELLGHFLEKER